MKKVKKDRKKRRIGYNQLGMIAIAAVAFLLLGALMMESSRLAGRLAVYNAKAATLEDEIAAEIERTDEIETLKEYMQTDEYAEEVARERLGLVKDNEIVFQESR